MISPSYMLRVRLYEHERAALDRIAAIVGTNRSPVVRTLIAVADAGASGVDRDGNADDEALPPLQAVLSDFAEPYDPLA